MKKLPITWAPAMGWCREGKILVQGLKDQGLKDRGVKSLTIIEAITHIRRSGLWSYSGINGLALQVWFVVSEYIFEETEFSGPTPAFWADLGYPDEVTNTISPAEWVHNQIRTPGNRRNNFFRRLYHHLRKIG